MLHVVASPTRLVLNVRSASVLMFIVVNFHGSERFHFIRVSHPTLLTFMFQKVIQFVHLRLSKCLLLFPYSYTISNSYIHMLCGILDEAIVGYRFLTWHLCVVELSSVMEIGSIYLLSLYSKKLSNYIHNTINGLLPISYISFRGVIHL